MTVLGDRDLALRFPGGDDAVVRAVYERYGRAIYTVAFSILRDAGQAADAVQATFVNAWRAAPRFDPSHELGPWLYTIARRAAIDAYRRDRRTESTDPAAFDAAEGAAGAADPFERTWEAWQVRLAIDELPGDEQLVVRMSWFEELTHPEIAERLGVPIGTVKSRSHRAHRRLAESLGHVRGANRTASRAVEDGESGGVSIDLTARGGAE